VITILEAVWEAAHFREPQRQLHAVLRKLQEGILGLVPMQLGWNRGLYHVVAWYQSCRTVARTTNSVGRTRLLYAI